MQTHGATQLSMGAAMLDGLIDVDTEFSLRLLPDAEGKARDPTTTSIREIFNLMEIQGHSYYLPRVSWPSPVNRKPLGLMIKYLGFI